MFLPFLTQKKYSSPEFQVRIGTQILTGNDSDRLNSVQFTMLWPLHKRAGRILSPIVYIYIVVLLKRNIQAYLVTDFFFALFTDKLLYCKLS